MCGAGRLRTREFLIKYQDEPWVRGQHDCLLFIWKYTSEVYHKPAADPAKYPFHDLKTAKRALLKLFKDKGIRSVEELLDSTYHRTDLPYGGCIVAKPDNEGLTGYTYGVCYEGYGIFVDRKGLVALELNPLTDLYWSIE